jgi:hypothetical protein
VAILFGFHRVPDSQFIEYILATTLNKKLLLLFVLLSQLQLCWAVLPQRAQTWKPLHLPGSAELSIAEIDVIVLPDAVPDVLRTTVDDLLALFEQCYGHAPKLVHLGQARPKHALYFELRADGREGGAFTIRRERTRVFVCGADAEAWCDALYAIMHDMLGARWYWAGDLGLEQISPRRLYFPNAAWRETPAFVQRKFYPVNTDFARRNRQNSVYAFNHNLARVFSAELYRSQPELFAEVNGRRKPPRGSGGMDPQPDFTQAGAVEVAAQAALDYFEAYPEGTSFSLSINDNVLFDTSERTEAVVSPVRYFRERPDYTDLVFGFMNRVAARVFDQAGAWQTPSGQDRYLTALSYYWTEPAPSIRVHPRVMPVLTSDRAQWHDPAYRKQDQDLIRAWVHSGAERVATWDYYFGAPYLYPRQFNQWIAESLQFLAKEGVDVFFSQLPAFWGLDGAKAWLASELLWDPKQDAEALLDEYYNGFFAAAAPSMRAFYETAERYRNTHEGRANWIKLYKDESNIELFSLEVLAEMRGHLEAAAQQVGVSAVAEEGLSVEQAAGKFSMSRDSSRFQRRVEVVSRAFRLTELYAAFYQARRALVMACLDAQASTEIESRLLLYQQADQAYRDYFEAYVGSTAYTPSRRSLALGQSQPERLAMGLLEPVPATFYSLASDSSLKHLGQEPRNFLGPNLPQLADWHFDYRASEHFKIEASERSVSQLAGLRVSGADMLSIFRKFPVISDQAYELRFTASWNISLDDRVHIHVAWLDRDGQTLEAEVPLRLPVEHRAEPVALRLPFTAPKNAYDVRIRFVVSRQSPGDYFDLSEIDFGGVR